VTRFLPDRDGVVKIDETGPVLLRHGGSVEALHAIYEREAQVAEARARHFSELADALETARCKSLDDEADRLHAARQACPLMEPAPRIQPAGGNVYPLALRRQRQGFSGDAA
jgi:hypothetical protein